MPQPTTDYLIIGSGAVGLAFADTLLTQDADAHLTIVDRHGKPGGHWNDAYSFVKLHQPSAYYGVASMPLGANLRDQVGLNKGFYELASGPEVSGYFDRVMHQRLLPSGRVRYHPLCEHLGGGRFVSILSGQEHRVTVRRKFVDATWYGTRVPSTQKPKYAVGDGVRLVTPNALPQLWLDRADPPRHFVVVGAGKTAMDAAIYLLESGAAPESIHWVVPRDSWLVNRAHTQPGIEFFEATIGGAASEMEAFAAASSPQDLFERLEACGQMLRIDRTRAPTMFHYATLSEGEVALLRRITQVVRLGHVQALNTTKSAGEIVLEQGRVAVPPNTLFIDCSASAVERKPISPIFQGERILLQLVRNPQPVFSAALVAYVEARYGDDAQKNALCTTAPFPDTIDGYPAAVLANMTNQLKWSQDKPLREWIADCRLDWTGRLMSQVDPADAAKQAILARFKIAARGAMANMPRLMQ